MRFKWPLIVAITMLLFGYGIGWFQYVKYPQLKSIRDVRMQQEEINKMTRHGELVEVKADSIVVKTDEEGTASYRINQYSSIQLGMSFVSQPGTKPDLTHFFNKGDFVDLLVKGGQAVLIHRDLRNGEDSVPPQSSPD